MSVLRFCLDCRIYLHTQHLPVYMSSSIGLSISSPTYFPFFFRCLTHSVRRYSICPFIERKSSSAHAAISSNNFAEILSGTCFFSAKTSPPCLFVLNKIDISYIINQVGSKGLQKLYCNPLGKFTNILIQRT